MKTMFIKCCIVLVIASSMTFSQSPDSSAELCGMQEDLIDTTTGLPKIAVLPELPDTIGSTHFLVHFSLQASDSNVTTTSYAESVKTFAEQSWQVEVNELGWNAPPPDGTFDMANRINSLAGNCNWKEKLTITERRS